MVVSAAKRSNRKKAGPIVEYSSQVTANEVRTESKERVVSKQSRNYRA